MLACINTLPVSLLPQAPSHIEVVSVKILSQPTPFIISVVYTPPSISDAHFTDTLNYLQLLRSSHDMPIYIVGDFNCPDVDWTLLTSSNCKSTQLCEMLFDNDLAQLIDFPTHIEGNLLDLFITNQDDSPPLISKLSNCPIVSDHVPILVTLPSPSDNSNYRVCTTPSNEFNSLRLTSSPYQITSLNMISLSTIVSLM